MSLDIAKKSLMNKSDSISAYTAYQDFKLAKMTIDRQQVSQNSNPKSAIQWIQKQFKDCQMTFNKGPDQYFNINPLNCS